MYFFWVLLKRTSLPIHCLLAGHKHPDFSFIAVDTSADQFRLLFSDLHSMEIDVQRIGQMLHLLQIQMRRHRIDHIFKYFLNHSKMPSFHIIVEEKGIFRLSDLTI